MPSNNQSERQDGLGYHDGAPKMPSSPSLAASRAGSRESRKLFKWCASKGRCLPKAVKHKLELHWQEVEIDRGGHTATAPPAQVNSKRSSTGSTECEKLERAIEGQLHYLPQGDFHGQEVRQRYKRQGIFHPASPFPFFLLHPNQEANLLPSIFHHSPNQALCNHSSHHLHTSRTSTSSQDVFPRVSVCLR